jgi:hypothetical protein
MNRFDLHKTKMNKELRRIGYILNAAAEVYIDAYEQEHGNNAIDGLVWIESKAMFVIVCTNSAERDKMKDYLNNRLADKAKEGYNEYRTI